MMWNLVQLVLLAAGVLLQHSLCIGLSDEHIAIALAPLEGQCFYYSMVAEWWSYKWCFAESVIQFHKNEDESKDENDVNLGDFVQKAGTSKSRQQYQTNVAQCEVSGTMMERSAVVMLHCCGHDGSLLQHKNTHMFGHDASTFIASVNEKTSCIYEIEVCTKHLCGNNVEETLVVSGRGRDQIQASMNNEGRSSIISDSQSTVGQINGFRGSEEKGTVQLAKLQVDKHEQAAMLDRARRMFIHAYDSYMEHAFPQGDLQPLSCTGTKFHLIKIPMVTLVDTLDTLIIMGNYTEFRRATKLLVEGLPRKFDFNVCVSLFETTIRILGGLLSSHLMAIDPKLNVYNTCADTEDASDLLYCYHDELLDLATDLGERLLTAFTSTSGIPYGTVNLRYGVPAKETPIASTAAAGTLMIEFEVLSSLTGNRTFGDLAANAAFGLYFRRSSLGLVGKHINVTSGKWKESVAGLGSHSDSFYEYLLKSHLLFDRKDFFRMFTDSFIAVKTHLQKDDKFFLDVEMNSGIVRYSRIENLQAFWPGVEASIGYTKMSAKELRFYFDVWNDLHVFPEDLEVGEWFMARNMSVYDVRPVDDSRIQQPSKEALSDEGPTVSHNYMKPVRYQLRPELIESTYHHYRATGDRSWLRAGELVLDSIEKHTRTDCGYAAIANGSTVPVELEDTMPSFFLSETCKYLYLLFDEDNFIHNRPYIFSTEAHPFDPVQIPKVVRNSSDYPLSKMFQPTKMAAAVFGAHDPAKELADSIRGFTTANSSKDSVDSNDILGQVSRHVVENDEHGEQAQLLETMSSIVDMDTISSSPQQRPIGFLSTNTPADSVIVEGQVMTGPTHMPLLPQTCTKTPWWQLRKSSFGFQPTQFSVHGYDNEFLYLHRSYMSDKSNHTNTNKKGGIAFEILNRAVGKLKKKPTQANVRRYDICYPGDQNDISSTPGSTQSPKQAQQQPQFIKLDMGLLGHFQVKIFGEGFTVTSAKYGDTLEISNVGENLVFVRDSNRSSYRSVMGDVSGNMITCIVKMDPVALMLVEAYDAAGTDGVVKGTIMSGEQHPLPFNLSDADVRDRYCSISSFGNEITQSGKQIYNNAPFMVSREIEVPEDMSGCRDVPKSSSWWPWTWGNRSTMSSDKIVVVNRGMCTFEQKAEVAMRGEANGLIVVNNEESLFIMASLRDAKKGKNKQSYSQHKTSPSTRDFPAVMMTKSDGDNLQSLVHSLQKKGVNPVVKVEVSSVPMILESESMGCFNYPKIHVREKVIAVYGRGPWGVMLTSAPETGKEWQLFIMPKADMTSVAPWSIVSQGGQDVSTTAEFNHNAVQLFSLLVSRKCHSLVTVLTGSSIVSVRKYSDSTASTVPAGRKGRIFPRPRKG